MHAPVPNLFLSSRNNGYAISTPISEQYAGDGIAARGSGYGMHTFRVDGNDALAVYETMKAAKAYALKHEAPVLIEAMTYRIGHHSTSDDSSAYRSKDEVEIWTNHHSPILRLRNYIERKGWWTLTDEEQLEKEIKEEIKRTFHAAENRKKPALQELFTDVYSELPWHLKEQQAELMRLVKQYPETYSVKDHVSE